jgi:1-acyl-sn-glycerol-3-phosphate acyltransferase
VTVDDWKMQPARDHGLSFLERLRSVVREDGLYTTGIRHAWWWMVRCHMALWHRLTIHKPEHLPTAFPFVVVANHSSHLDSLVLTAALPWHLRSRTSSLAAGDVFFDSPFRGVFAATLLNALPLWRHKHSGRSLQILRQRLIEQDCGYVVFPEGTRSRDGRMNSFRAGIGMLVAGTKVPVIPCYLVGCHDALCPGERIPRRVRIELHVGQPLKFDEVDNKKTGWESVALKLEEAVRASAVDL